jgi:hypothetical protein
MASARARPLICRGRVLRGFARYKIGQCARKKMSILVGFNLRDREADSALSPASSPLGERRNKSVSKFPPREEALIKKSLERVRSCQGTRQNKNCALLDKDNSVLYRYARDLGEGASGVVVLFERKKSDLVPTMCVKFFGNDEQGMKDFENEQFVIKEFEKKLPAGDRVIAVPMPTWTPRAVLMEAAEGDLESFRRKLGVLSAARVLRGMVEELKNIFDGTKLLAVDVTLANFLYIRQPGYVKVMVADYGAFTRRKREKVTMSNFTSPAIPLEDNVVTCKSNALFACGVCFLSLQRDCPPEIATGTEPKKFLVNGREIKEEIPWGFDFNSEHGAKRANALRDYMRIHPVAGALLAQLILFDSANGSFSNPQANCEKEDDSFKLALSWIDNTLISLDKSKGENAAPK